jgi:hypothetical protein
MVTDFASKFSCAIVVDGVLKASVVLEISGSSLIEKFSALSDVMEKFS